MVAVPVRHFGSRRGEKGGLESHSSNLDNTSVMRKDTGREFVCEKNAGEPSHCYDIYVKMACHKAPASLPTHHGIQLPLDSHGENDGSAGALCDIDAKQRSDNRDGENDRMEFGEGSETTPSV